MFRLLLIWHSKSEFFPVGPRLLSFTAHLSHSGFSENQEGLRRGGAVLSPAEIATLIAPILWLLRQIAGAFISRESSPIFAAALSRATQVPLIVYVLNAEPLECIHF